MSFIAKLEGAEQYVSVGDGWINHTSNTAAMIKEVCGSYPSMWNGKKCSEMIPMLESGISELEEHSEDYRQYEPGSGWGTVESTISFLDNILKNCKLFPTAIIEVDA